MLVALALVAVTTAACGGESSKDTSAAPARDGDAVTMRLIAYRPESLAVKPGTTVTWSQEDAGVHTVTSGTVMQEGGGVSSMPDGKFESGEIATGDVYTFTFEDAGTYPYFCEIHPATMRGEVEVR